MSKLPLIYTILQRAGMNLIEERKKSIAMLLDYWSTVSPIRIFKFWYQRLHARVRWVVKFVDM